MNIKSIFNRIESVVLTTVAGEPFIRNRITKVVPFIDGKARPDLVDIHNEEKLLELGYLQHLDAGETGVPKISYGRYTFIQ